MFPCKTRVSRLWKLVLLLNVSTTSSLPKFKDKSVDIVNDSFLEENPAGTNVSFESNEYIFNATNNTVYVTVMQDVVSPLYVIFVPSLVTLGISGNLLSLYVFYRSRLRTHSTSQYLSALAVSDSVFLGQLLPPWLSTTQINSMFNRDGYCKGFVYVSYVTCCLSSWLVIAFTVERFVAVQYPMQRPSMCTVKRARYVIVGLSMGSMIVNLPVIYLAGSGDEICNIDRDKLEQAARFNWVDTIVAFTLPLLLIIIMNTWIAAIVCKLERERAKLTEQAGSARSQEPLYPRSQQRVTNMLLIVSTIFVIFNCPAYTLRVWGYVYDMDAKELDDRWLTAQTVATMMFNANFGINFFLYCLTGQNFRRALQQTVPCFGRVARTAGAVAARAAASRARSGSVATSAASTGTDATCVELPSARPAARRKRHRQYILRWTFDNSRQRRAAGVSGAPECIEMQEMSPRPGPPRAPADERPRRALPPHAARVERPRASCMRRLLRPLRRNSAERRRKDAHLYD